MNKIKITKKYKNHESTDISETEEFLDKIIEK